ncbi:MAG: response regulator [Opitutales bacterium]|nr:response regulator [Opitutales bacterium]
MSSSPDPLPGIPLSPIRVIVVENEECVADVLRDLLECKGYLVETYSCPITALKQLGMERFDVLLLDYRMPSMDGGQFFEKARRRGLSLPTVLVSGFVNDAQLLKMANLGLRRFLQKPVSGVALFDCLQSLGFGPDEVLSRKARWNEWRALLATRIKMIEQGADLRFPESPPHDLLFPLQMASQRNLLLDAAALWRKTGIQALTGEAGLDFEPFFDALLTEASFGGRQAEHLDGTTNAFQNALQNNQAADTIPVGWFNDANALHQALEKWVAHGARGPIGWVFEEKTHVRATPHPFWKPYRLPPLRERPEAVLYYASEILALQTRKTSGQAWSWQPDCGPILLGQFWPGNFRDLSACIERIILHTAEENVRASTLREVMDSTAASGNNSPAQDALAHTLWPVLRRTNDNHLLATLFGMPVDRIAAARAALPPEISSPTEP